MRFIFVFEKNYVDSSTGVVHINSDLLPEHVDETILRTQNSNIKIQGFPLIT